MKKRNFNDNTVLSFIVLFLMSLLAMAAIAVVIGFSFVIDSGRSLPTGERTDYSIGAGLCLIAAVGALGTGLLALIKLINAWK